MPDNKRIAFIINPKSGVSNKNKIHQLVVDYQFEHCEKEIVYTERAFHATELSSKLAAEKFDIVVAVGGDGTVNEVAKGLLFSETAMGIIPTGSGNGLARHLSLPLSPELAIAKIDQGLSTSIDVCYVNDIPYLCTAGVGFDAHISHIFDAAPTRGFLTYFKLTLSAFLNYAPKEYHLNIDDKRKNGKYMLITVANANQWGNNAYISPLSKINDAKFEICLLKKFPTYQSAEFAQKLFRKKLYTFKGMEYLQSNSFIIYNQNPINIHIDGEPRIIEGNLNFSIKNKILKVIV